MANSLNLSGEQIKGLRNEGLLESLNVAYDDFVSLRLPAYLKSLVESVSWPGLKLSLSNARNLGKHDSIESTRTWKEVYYLHYSYKNSRGKIKLLEYPVLDKMKTCVINGHERCCVFKLNRRSLVFYHDETEGLVMNVNDLLGRYLSVYYDDKGRTRLR